MRSVGLMPRIGDRWFCSASVWSRFSTLDCPPFPPLGALCCYYNTDRLLRQLFFVLLRAVHGGNVALDGGERKRKSPSIIQGMVGVRQGLTEPPLGPFILGDFLAEVRRREGANVPCAEAERIPHDAAAVLCFDVTERAVVVVDERPVEAGGPEHGVRDSVKALDPVDELLDDDDRVTRSVPCRLEDGFGLCAPPVHRVGVGSGV